MNNQRRKARIVPALTGNGWIVHPDDRVAQRPEHPSEEQAEENAPSNGAHK